MELIRSYDANINKLKEQNFRVEQHNQSNTTNIQVIIELIESNQLDAAKESLEHAGITPTITTENNVSVIQFKYAHREYTIKCNSRSEDIAPIDTNNSAENKTDNLNGLIAQLQSGDISAIPELLAELKASGLKPGTDIQFCAVCPRATAEENENFGPILWNYMYEESFLSALQSGKYQKVEFRFQLGNDIYDFNFHNMTRAEYYRDGVSGKPYNGVLSDGRICHGYEFFTDDINTQNSTTVSEDLEETANAPTHSSNSNIPDNQDSEEFELPLISENNVHTQNKRWAPENYDFRTPEFLSKYTKEELKFLESLPAQPSVELLYDLFSKLSQDEFVRVLEYLGAVGVEGQGQLVNNTASFTFEKDYDKFGFFITLGNGYGLAFSNKTPGNSSLQNYVTSSEYQTSIYNKAFKDFDVLAEQYKNSPTDENNIFKNGVFQELVKHYDWDEIKEIINKFIATDPNASVTWILNDFHNGQTDYEAYIDFGGEQFYLSGGKGYGKEVPTLKNLGTMNGKDWNNVHKLSDLPNFNPDFPYQLNSYAEMLYDELNNNTSYNISYTSDGKYVILTFEGSGADYSARGNHHNVLIPTELWENIKFNKEHGIDKSSCEYNTQNGNNTNAAMNINTVKSWFTFCFSIAHVNNPDYDSSHIRIDLDRIMKYLNTGIFYQKSDDELNELQTYPQVNAVIYAILEAAGVKDLDSVDFNNLKNKNLFEQLDIRENDVEKMLAEFFNNAGNSSYSVSSSELFNYLENLGYDDKFFAEYIANNIKIPTTPTITPEEQQEIDTQQTEATTVISSNFINVITSVDGENIDNNSMDEAIKYIEENIETILGSIYEDIKNNPNIKDPDKFIKDIISNIKMFVEATEILVQRIKQVKDTKTFLDYRNYEHDLALLFPNLGTNNIQYLMCSLFHYINDRMSTCINMNDFVNNVNNLNIVDFLKEFLNNWTSKEYYENNHAW